jgi:hypothetical protein
VTNVTDTSGTARDQRETEKQNDPGDQHLSSHGHEGHEAMQALLERQHHGTRRCNGEEAGNADCDHADIEYNLSGECQRGILQRLAAPRRYPCGRKSAEQTTAWSEAKTRKLRAMP